MLLDGWHWASLAVMSIPFAMIPFILEFSVVFSVHNFKKISEHITNQQKEEEDRRKENAEIKRQQERDLKINA